MTAIKLEGEAYAVAKDIHDTATKYHEKLRALQAEFAQVQLEMGNALRARWPRLLAAVGQPEANPADFNLDARYLEPHGLLFLNDDDDDDAEPASAPADQPQSLRRH